MVIFNSAYKNKKFLSRYDGGSPDSKNRRVFSNRSKRFKDQRPSFYTVNNSARRRVLALLSVPDSVKIYQYLA